ncbi:carnitine O-acetyltransferase [Coccidioides immitis H538.4]|uniref:Carnitine O-acetyltransferase n=1 Tax=Coccidioides immitis H538.4 TaxID=396776 RepID=A0A0J8S6W9_COCIT|nr:carnitine O-acetyltransferase [Coccidioides immitis H538.4]
MFPAAARGRLVALGRASLPRPARTPVITMAARRANSSVPAGYTEDLSKGRMLRFEDSLPQLPVPTLEETGKKYLKSLHPLLSAEEFKRSQKAVEAFVKPGGEGETLQKRLLAKAADPKVQNWLYDWWNHAAYLGYRDPVVPYVSYFYSYRDDRNRRDPAKRAAAITTSQQFEKILKNAERVPAVGALTSENRDFWTAARKKLLAADPANADALKTIESASFVVCLDDTAPVTLEERAHVYWHGDGANRWFDKPLTFIVNDNGTAGFLGEHSMMDGTPTHRLNDYVNNLIFNNRLDYSKPSVRSNLPEPQPVNFNLDSAVLEDITTAQKDFASVIGKHELRVQAFQAYGKGLIKKFKCSPDAYVQMLIQLAYFKMYGKNRPTYESASTRKFKQGRTETTRTVSDDSVAFCKAHCDPAVPREETAKLFRAALAAHTKYIADASIGKGVDRHLFGLKQLIQKGEKVPALYEDPAYGYSGSWYLSTSQLSSEYFNGYGWSQVIDDGFGIAYMINENSLQFNIVCKKLGADRMSFYLNEAACEVRDLLMPDLLAQQEKAKL